MGEEVGTWGGDKSWGAATPSLLRTTSRHAHPGPASSDPWPVSPPPRLEGEGGGVAPGAQRLPPAPPFTRTAGSGARPGHQR